MTPIETAFIILGVVAALGVAAFVVQTIENQRQRQRELLQGMRNEIRLAEQIYSAIPGILMSESLYRYFSQYLLRKWQQLLQMDNRSQWQQAAKESAQQFKEYTPSAHPEGSLTLTTSKAQAQTAHLAVRNLLRWLKQQEQSAKINKATVQELSSHANYCLQRLAIDNTLFEAMEYEAAKGPKVAIHQYSNALRLLERVDHRQLADRQMYEVRTHINSLQQIIDTEQPAAAHTEADSAQQGN